MDWIGINPNRCHLLQTIREVQITFREVDGPTLYAGMPRILWINIVFHSDEREHVLLEARVIFPLWIVGRRVRYCIAGCRELAGIGECGVARALAAAALGCCERRHNGEQANHYNDS